MQTLWIEADDVAAHTQQLVSSGALMVMPCTDEAQARRAMAMASARAGEGMQQALLLAVHDARRQGFVSVVNQVFRHSRSPWFGYMAPRGTTTLRPGTALSCSTVNCASVCN